MTPENRQLIKTHAEVKKLLKRMTLTCQPLESDLNFARMEWMKEEGNQFWCRTVIRCLFSYVECVMWNMKHVCPKIAEVSKATLSPEDLEFIREQKTKMMDGREHVRRFFPKFHENIKGTFSVFAKAHGFVFPLQFGDKGFQDLCATYELRSRLVHPKTPFDPSVSVPEMRRAQAAVGWFNEEYQRLLNESQEQILKMFSPGKV